MGEPPTNTPLSDVQFPLAFLLLALETTNNVLATYSSPKTPCHHLFFQAGHAVWEEKYPEKEAGGEKSHAWQAGRCTPRL